MNDQNIPFGRPMIDESEINAVINVLSGPTLVHGQITKEFERSFAERVGVKHAISVSSCTAGLHLSLFSNNIGPGDEVLVPAMTHVATAHSVEYCGATPIFVDVEDFSGNINYNAIPDLISDKTKAAIVVHYLGLPCEMDSILSITNSREIFVIEDCALAIDAKYGDKNAGNLGLTGCFSFYPIKHMTSVEGGMVTTNDDNIAKQIYQRRAFGYDQALNQRSMPGIYDVSSLGYNYRMNEIEAAIGLSQLAKLDKFQKIRSTNYNNLMEGLSSVEEITVFQPSQGKAKSSHYCLNAVLPRDGSINRSDIVKTLNENGIGTSVHYPKAVPMFSYYRNKYGFEEGQFPIAEWISNQTISLPVAPHVQTEDIHRIVKVFKKALINFRKTN